MKPIPRVILTALVLLVTLAACGSKSNGTSPQAITTGLIASPHTAESSLPANTSTPIPQVTAAVVPTSTRTPSLPTATSTSLPSPTRTTIPLELTGSQAMIEKTFQLEGFQFAPPLESGERIGYYGSLELSQANGDLYNMSIFIRTTCIGEALFRAQIGFVVPRHLSTGEMAYVQDLMHQFISVSESDWTTGPAWVDATLPQLESLTGQEARTNSGDILVIMHLAPASEGLAYVLTISADPDDQ